MDSRVHLQRCGIGGSFHIRLIHGSGLRGTYDELTGVDHLEQVDIFAASVELGIEKGGAVVVELAASEPVRPPWWLAVLWSICWERSRRMTCMRAIWMELASSRTGRTKVATPRRARSAERRMRSS